MKNLKQDISTVAKKGITRREGLMLTLLGSALVLAGCGGGGGGSSPAGGGTVGAAGSSASGAITGFGSIIVGGVHYEDSTATSIKDDDGVSKSSNELKMGMVVKIKGGKKYKDGASIKASCDSIEVHSELQGPVDSITPATATAPASIVVLGQTVAISATTFFDDGLTFASLATGNVVEVYGFIDPLTNTMAATRVELKPNANKFKLQGAISGLNTVSQTFRIGTLTISYLTAELPASLILANNLVVRVRLAITPLTGTRTALRIRAAEDKHDDIDEAEVEGFITKITSLTVFEVNGLVVNTNATTKFDFPVGTILQVGDRVEVEGSIVNGILIAKEVELEDDEDDEDMFKFELHGLVSMLVQPTTTTGTFMLRGVPVSYDGTTQFPDKVTRANLVIGSNVEVKGRLLDGNKLMATHISSKT